MTTETETITVELDSPNGPRVIAPRLASVEILGELPLGWTVHPDDWQNGIDLGGRQAFALSYTIDDTNVVRDT